MGTNGIFQLLGRFFDALFARSEKGVLQGRIVWIEDGSSCVLRTPRGKEIRIRLYGIQAPGQGEPYAKESKTCLISLVKNRKVRVKVKSKDSCGGVVGRIMAGRREANREMLRCGAAFLEQQCVAEAFDLYAAQSEARAACRGVWAPGKEADGALSGYAARVYDGDSFALSTGEGKEASVHLRGVAAPLKQEPYGIESRGILISLLKGQPVRVVGNETDSYGRIVGRAYVGNLCINLEMVRQGAACHDRVHAPDDAELAEAQQAARTEGRGLWHSALDPAAGMAGPVVWIGEGNSFAFRTIDQRNVNVHLYGVEAPAKDEFFRAESREALAGLIKGKRVLVYGGAADALGRMLSRVYVDGVYVNLEMVRMGAALHISKYAPHEDDLCWAQAEAMAAHAGIWSAMEALPSGQGLSSPGCMSALAVRVFDGDSFWAVTDACEECEIRLYGIDAPENAQEYGREAGEALASLIYGKIIRVERKDMDRYGRLVARVYVGDTYVNLEMLRRGAAWHYARHAPHEHDLKEAFRNARITGIGLWGLPDPLAPWTFRKRQAAADNLIA